MSEKVVDIFQVKRNIIVIDITSETIGSSKMDSANIKKKSKKKYGDCSPPLDKTVYIAMKAKMLAYMRPRNSGEIRDEDTILRMPIYPSMRIALISR